MYFTVHLNRTTLLINNGYLCVEPGLGCVVCLPATLRRSDDAKTRKESMCEAFMLAAYGFWQVICVTKL